MLVKHKYSCDYSIHRSELGTYKLYRLKSELLFIELSGCTLGKFKILYVMS